jgi:hypothetical protein
VVSSETGTGLRNVQIRLSGGGLRAGRAVGTDDVGRYEILNLPAGRYTLTASKPGLVTLSYGQRRPFESGRPVELADKQTLQDIDVALPRGGVIVARVTDEFGDPMAGVRVRAERYRYTQGQWELASVGGGSSSPFGGGTDDRGEMRVYGLPPGDYFVTATGGSGPALISGPIGAADSGRRYTTTYYPGTGSPADAQKVQVQVGREVHVTFPIVTARFARVHVNVRGSDGNPLRQPSVSLSYRTAGGGGTRALAAQPDGSYALSDVPPGDYAIDVSPPFNERSATGEYASMPIKVAGEDVRLSVTTGRGGRTRGRFVFDTPPTPDVRPSLLRPSITRGPTAGFGLGGLPVVNDDWTFELGGLVGQGTLSLSAQASGWHLKQVIVNGKDVIDTPLDFSDGRDIEDVQMVVTRVRSTIDGSVSDGQNTPVAEFVAVVFPEEREKWTAQSRFISAGRPDQQGAFKISGLPPGRYLVAAVDYLETGAEFDLDVLERLRSAATPVVVGEGESKSVNLKLTAF